MQDSPLCLVDCTSSRIGRDKAWKLLQKNWLKLAERFGEKSCFLIRFCEVNLIEEKLISVKIYYLENPNLYINHEAFVEINWNSQWSIDVDWIQLFLIVSSFYLLTACMTIKSNNRYCVENTYQSEKSSREYARDLIRSLTCNYYFVDFDKQISTCVKTTIIFCMST